MTQSYDLFLSYARVDQEQGDDDDGRQSSKFATRLASEMERAFRARTGQPLRIFLDVLEINTAQMWEDRIVGALEVSKLLVAVLTPSYFTSRWCTQEWDWFEGREERLRREGRLPASDALIFPVLYRDLDKVLDRGAQGRVRAAMKRQYRDLRQVDPASLAFRADVRTLIDEVIAALLRLQELDVPTADRVAEATRRHAADPGAEAPPFPPTAMRSQRVRTRIGDDEQFIEQLSRAERAVIVGLTNVRLPVFLEEALRRKRRIRGPEAFWSSIDVVFASEAVLSFVHDELNIEFPSRDEATRIRCQQAERGREAVASFLLRANRPRQWTFKQYPYLPPFVGAMMEMQDGSRLIQVATLRPAYGVADYLFLEFFEMAGEVAYYQGAFDLIRQESETIEEVLLVGIPNHDGDGFYCRAPRFRRAVLAEGRDPAEWVPIVIVCTYSNHPDGPQPLLQVRTKGNADREIGRISHVSGYVYQRDCEEPARAGGFPLPESAARTAAVRKLRQVLSVDADPDPVGQVRYHSSNTESMYFYLYGAELPYTLPLPPESHVQTWTLSELALVREYQVLTQAQQLLEPNRLTRQAGNSLRAAGLNLILHGHDELGRQLVDRAREGGRAQAGADPALDEVRRLRARAVPHRRVPGEGRSVEGLSGLQFREFFSWLLPFYARIGVVGAEDALRRVTDHAERKAALESLTALYANERAMRAMVLSE